MSVEHELVRRGLVSLPLLLKRNSKGIQSLLIVDGCFQVKKSLQEKNFTGGRHLACSSGLILALDASLSTNTGVVCALSKESARLTIHITCNLRHVSAVSFLSLNESWQLLSVHQGSFLARSHSLAGTSALLLRERTTSGGLDARYLRLLDGVNQLFDRLLQKVNFPHLALFIFLNSSLNSVKPSLVELLRLDQHLNPLLLLSFEIFDNGLMIYQVLFIL